MQVVGGRPQVVRVAEGVDVFQADERAVALARLRREQVEEQVVECERAVGLAHEGEWHLGNVGEPTRSYGPRNPSTVVADSLRDDLGSGRLGDGDGHDPTGFVLQRQSDVSLYPTSLIGARSSSFGSHP